MILWIVQQLINVKIESEITTECEIISADVTPVTTLCRVDCGEAEVCPLYRVFSSFHTA